MTDQGSITTAACAYLSAGLCVLPARRAEKRPAVGRWKQYQKRLPTEAELSAWLANNPDAVCILCGQASGNAEILDFDARGELFDRWCAKVRTAAPGLLERLVLSRTQSDGRHAVYRCIAAVSGNLKLAQRKVGDKVVTLIETRGEGGLFLCAPTAGYEVIQGDLADLPVLTEAERDILLQAAWELNEYLPPVVDGPALSANVGQRVGLLAENGHLSADNAHNGDCRSDSGAVGQRSQSSVAQADCPSDNAHPGDCSPHNGDVGQRSPSSAEQCDGAADNPHIGCCSSSNAAVGQTTASSADNGGSLADDAHRPGDDFNVRGDVRAVLENAGWSLARAGENEYWRRPGKTSGWSATLKDRVFYVFTSNASPFEPNTAYSPFAVYTLINHGGDYDQAAGMLRLQQFGTDSLPDITGSVDISGIMAAANAPLADMANCGPENAHIPACSPENANLGGCAAESADIRASLADNADSGDGPPEIADPGPIPEHLFRVPGFVAQVMDFTLANAPYPNLGLAFCGAMAVQSYLAGRKVCDEGDLRPNIYLLALASSGTGKDFPRKVNSRVLFEIGHVSALGDKFASGEGIQDALARTSVMLFQNDEMDGVLRQINLDRENKRESIPNILLTLYTSANDVYPIRVKAGQKEAAHIDQPHMTLFGTATPQYFYEALSQRMLTNGFFARLIIVDIGKRGEGQTPGSARHLPEGILQTARWWAECQPGSRRANLLEVHPEPRVVPCTPEAKAAIDALQRQTEAEYDLAHARNDEVSRVAWSRTHENAKKLALLYACSENHEDPAISLPAVEWAQAFAMHQTRRQLFLASSYVAENPFHAECLKVVRKLRESPERQLQHQVLLKRMKMKTKDFKELIETLIQRGDLLAMPIQTAGRTGLIYRLAETVKEGEGR
jgi:hypothetical protein